MHEIINAVISEFLLKNLTLPHTPTHTHTQTWLFSSCLWNKVKTKGCHQSWLLLSLTQHWLLISLCPELLIFLLSTVEIWDCGCTISVPMELLQEPEASPIITEQGAQYHSLVDYPRDDFLFALLNSSDNSIGSNAIHLLRDSLLTTQHNSHVVVN